MDIDGLSEPASGHPHDQQDDHEGDYSTRMEELFEGDHDASFEHSGHFGLSDDEEANPGPDFGERTSMTKETYKNQLKDVLGSDQEEDVGAEADDDELEEKEVEKSLVHGSGQAERDGLLAEESFVSAHWACSPPVLCATDCPSPFVPVASRAHLRYYAIFALSSSFHSPTHVFPSNTRRDAL